MALGQIDWSVPWLDDWRELGEPLWRDVVAGQTVADALNARLAHQTDPPRVAAGPLSFVAQTGLAAGEPYESFIHRTGQVPTRHNLHDFFNGLAWLRFPAIKARLNALQSIEIERAPDLRRRGAVRDALTLFDENAALWQAPAVLADALRRRDWHALFITHRALWSSTRPTLFGHALLEKLVTPRKAVTAHVWLMPQQGDLRVAIQGTLTPAALAAKPFAPLPVLGVPGWWPANEAIGFYDDLQVFRPVSGTSRSAHDHSGAA